jgi:hypothetical protein
MKLYGFFSAAIYVCSERTLLEKELQEHGVKRVHFGSIMCAWVLQSSFSSFSLSGFFLPLLAMFRDLVELILGKIVKGDVEMRTRNIAAGLETRPLEKIPKPFRNLGILSN